jgi:hypothetical protein
MALVLSGLPVANTGADLAGLASIDLGPFATVELASPAKSASTSGVPGSWLLVPARADRETAILPLLLTLAAESAQRGPRAFGDLRPPAGLAALLAPDAFGGGLIANAVVGY